MSKYDNIPISNKTSKGMTLTSSDRQWLKRAFDLQDTATEGLIKVAIDLRDKLLCETIRELFEEIKTDLKSIHLEIKELRLEIKNINMEIEDLRKRVADHEFRIGHIENKLEI